MIVPIRKGGVMTDEARRVSDANKAVMERFYAEVVNAGNIDLIDELLTEDFVEHEDFPGITSDREGVKQFFGMFLGAFPDATFTPEQVLGDGDLVAARVRVRGTHQGEFMGVPATGKPIDVQAIDVVSFTDGKGTAHWGVFDAMTMMQQLGAMPEPG
jgi:steroid delta-isomerase-like uncharacterized protein